VKKEEESMDLEWKNEEEEEEDAIKGGSKFLRESAY